MSLLKEIGAILGFVAFGGMAVLAFLTFQQARHVRRLREWAGRSPERAAAAAERVSGAADEATIGRAGGIGEEPGMEGGPGRMQRVKGEVAYRWEEVDRRSPADLKILVIGLIAILIGVGIVTSGFGIVGGSEDTPVTSTADGTNPAGKPAKVAVLNGTAPVEGGEGVPGVAKAASGYVKDANFKVGAVDNTATPFPASVVMFAGGDAKADAEQLAQELDPQLGSVEVVAMTPEVKDVAGRADIALIVGADDQGIS